MKVKSLIELLKTIDGEKNIILQDSEFPSCDLEKENITETEDELIIY